MEEKIVKLTNTAYKILDYFPESDPLKKRAKDKALAIMSAIGTHLSDGQVDSNQNIIKDIDIFLGYLQIGRLQGWISPANFLIIANEYEKIKKSAQNPLLADIVADPSQSRPKASLGGEEQKDLSPRQDKIIDFLAKKEKAQVSDLQTILNNVTKRTIRRDLDELLKKGEISRFGEFSQIFYQIKKDRTDRTKV